MNDPFSPVNGTARKLASNKPTWTPVAPMPLNVPPPPTEHPKLSRPTATWTYHGADGGVLGYVMRFDLAPGDKVFRPLVYMKPITGAGNPEWRWESWPPPRPLYGLDRLAQRSAAPVVICEGEKSADAAQRLLPGFVAVTSPNGSKSAGKADWSVLKDRAVVIWPDADEPGHEYARMVAKLVTAAGATSVKIVEPPAGSPAGWDAADALAASWNDARTTALIATAKAQTAANAAAAGATDDEKDFGGGRKRTPQRDLLIGCTDCCDLWHDANRTAYASFPVNSHREHWAIRSREFRMWLSGRFYAQTGAAIGGQALEDGIRILEARAVNEGLEHEVFTRIGRHGDKLYLDLGAPDWRAVEITATGWEVVNEPAPKLLRSPSMRMLPEPEAGGRIESLRGFLNVRDDDDFMLVVAWLVAGGPERRPDPGRAERRPRPRCIGRQFLAHGLRQSFERTELAFGRALPARDRIGLRHQNAAHR